LINGDGKDAKIQIADAPALRCSWQAKTCYTMRWEDWIKGEHATSECGRSQLVIVQES